ncbi:MAG: biotin synthase auxiliary protein BsaP [Mycobacteriaceae bacterium]
MGPDARTFCTACGEPNGPHERCELSLELEPPRFCGECGRRMVVQVRPHGWWARCSRHGVTDSVDTGRR